MEVAVTCMQTENKCRQHQNLQWDVNHWIEQVLDGETIYIYRSMELCPVLQVEDDGFVEECRLLGYGAL
jgi:hypothetical protein